MTQKILLIAISIGVFVYASAAQAAEVIIVQAATSTTPALISIEGEFVQGDEKEFTRRVLDVDTAIVRLSSPGGNLYAGIQMGKAIRLKQFSTLVTNDSTCASACALA
ncbi:MAG: hypothetical protein KGO53_08440 [Alphaproteobacteria bacterium]|nr:hypothetical protein [Alphaproteobacteria bacterium]